MYGMCISRFEMITNLIVFSVLVNDYEGYVNHPDKFPYACGKENCQQIKNCS